MTGMVRKGIHPRVVDLRSAANRLRWEVDWALGGWPGHTPNANDWIDASSAVDEIAETVAILRVALDTMVEKIPEEHQRGFLFSGDIQQKLASRLEYYLDYHKVAR